MKSLENVVIKEKNGRYCISADLLTSAFLRPSKRAAIKVVRKRGIQASKRPFSYEDDEEWIDYETGEIVPDDIVGLLNMEVRKYRARKDCAGIFDE